MVVDQKKSIQLSRYFQITSCYKGAKCLGPTVKDLENANVALPFESFAKSDARGVVAVDDYKIVDEGVEFNSRISITKHQNTDGYHVYVMLRSGSSLKRNGIVKTFDVANLSELKKTVVSDLPISFNNGTKRSGTLKAELIVDQPLNIYVENK